MSTQISDVTKLLVRAAEAAKRLEIDDPKWQALLEVVNKGNLQKQKTKDALHCIINDASNTLKVLVEHKNKSHIEGAVLLCHAVNWWCIFEVNRNCNRYQERCEKACRDVIDYCQAL